MIFNVRPLNETDYDDILVGWWKDWGLEPPVRDFLPDNGMGGIIVLDGDIPVCAGFMYATNSKIVWINWIISNKKYRVKPNRKEAIKLLLETLSTISKNAGCQYGYALIQNNGLVEIYKQLGYTESHIYTQELIKKL
jgi:hypothetical protein